MKLYYSPGACSLSPHIVAQEAGIACELIQADLKSHTLKDQTDFYTINPLGYVPVLELNFIGTELHKGFSPLFSPDTPQDFKPTIQKRLLQRFTWVNEQLANRAYLMGEQFTVADAYLFTVAGWGKFVGVDLSGLAHLQAYLVRVGNRPAVQAALRAEGLL